jgi:hypothetical protein
MSLGSAQPLTEMNTRNISWGVKAAGVLADNLTYLLTYLLHGAESFLRSQPVKFAASQEIPCIYGTRKLLTELESSSPYPQVPATCPYPEPTQSSPYDPLQFPEDPS